MGLEDWIARQDKSKGLKHFGGVGGALMGAGDVFTQMAMAVASQKPGQSVGDAIALGIGRGTEKMQGTFQRTRENREDRDFEGWAEEEAAKHEEGSRVHQFYKMIGAGRAGERMGKLLPGLYAAEKADAAGGPRSLTLPNVRSDKDTNNFRERFMKSGVGIVDLAVDLQNPESELSKAMLGTYAGAQDPANDPDLMRFRTWVLYNRNLQKAKRGTVDYGEWGYIPEKGEYGPIRIAKDPGDTPQIEPEADLIDQAMNWGKNLLGIGGEEDDAAIKPAMGLEDELAAELGITAEPPPGVPPVRAAMPGGEPGFMAPGLDPTMRNLMGVPAPPKNRRSLSRREKALIETRGMRTSDSQILGDIAGVFKKEAGQDAYKGLGPRLGSDLLGLGQNALLGTKNLLAPRPERDGIGSVPLPNFYELGTNARKRFMLGLGN